SARRSSPIWPTDGHGGPEMAPKPPNVRSAPAQPWRFSGVVNVVGPEMAPKPPNVRSAPAQPWRFSGVVNVVGPEMAPNPPTFAAPRRSRGASLEWLTSWAPKWPPIPPTFGVPRQSRGTPLYQLYQPLPLLRWAQGSVTVWPLFAPGSRIGPQGRRCESAATPSL